MENRAHALAAGLFALLLIAGLVAGAVWIRGDTVAYDAYVLHTRGNVTGLNIQAPVRFRGVEVGRVEDIRFDPQDPRLILVGISVRSGTPLTLGVHGQLAAQGVTGLAYVQLADDGSNSALRDPSDSAQARIELRPSFFERVSDSGEQLVVRVAAVAQQLEKWLADDNRRAVTEALTALQAASKKVGALSEAATPGVQSVPDLTRQAAQTLRNADTAITDLRALVAQLGKRLDAIERIAASAERVGAAVQQVSAAGTSLSITASRDTMPKLNQLLDEIARSTRGLERLVEDLSANPSSIVFGRAPLPPGPGEPGFVHGAPR